MKLRPAVVDDLEHVKAIRQAAFASHAPSAYSPREVANLLDDLDEEELVEMIKERQLFVAEVGGRVVGCAGWRTGSLRHVYVSPGSERTGVGTRLVVQVEADFVDRTTLTEIAVGSVFYARPFYESLGYEVVSTETAWDGSSFLEMKKGLGNQS